jgi:hypothetical protein
MLKNLFTANGRWTGLLKGGGLPEIDLESISKISACGTSTLCVKHLTCHVELPDALWHRHLSSHAVTKLPMGTGKALAIV